VPGMTGGLTTSNATLQAAFKTALLNQGEIALLIFVTLAIAWVACRELLPIRVKARLAARQAARPAEPAGRKLLRIGFGALWVLDAILQAQPAMPAGLPSDVIAPSAEGSPGWLLHLVNWAGTGWSFHPIQAAASVVWIQLGVGVWLIAAARGPWSRLAGTASVGWGLVVWIFGEAAGGVLGPGVTFLNGAPGAALIYVAAGALIALPERYWHSARLGRVTLQICGGGLVAFALLQAWPGNGFWEGRLDGSLGPIAAMVKSMAATSQPAVLARLVSDFGALAAAHGFAVNLVAVAVLAVTGAGLLSGRLSLVRPAMIVAIAFFLADWVLVQDLGFFGGLGTDPNSMIPLSILVIAAFLAMTRLPAAPVPKALIPEAPVREAPVPETRVPEAPVPEAPVPAAPMIALAQPETPRQTEDPELAADGSGPVRPGLGRGLSRRLRIALGTASASVVVALWAGGVIALGAGPMALAEASRTADPIIATALDGSAATLNFRAAAFNLTDQFGRPVSLASLHGKVVLMTFLDPVCTNDCPLIAQEFRQADQVLGGRAHQVELVAIVANPLYRSTAYTRAFDRQELLTGLPNWLFLTGSLPQLSQTWKDYYVTAQLNGPGAMALHPDVAYVIDANGVVRTELNMDPGPGSASSESSFAVELANSAEHVVGSS
jgi:cytochrome oxidase Cu insertion factor (SCO1/SenC/PrrC family)